MCGPRRAAVTESLRIDSLLCGQRERFRRRREIRAARLRFSRRLNNKQQFDRSIVEGPIGPAVWRLAWPTMLQNIIAGVQGIIDHVMVGHYVGYTGNAAIGVSMQMVIVVIVFISSLF